MLDTTLWGWKSCLAYYDANACVSRTEEVRLIQCIIRCSCTAFWPMRDPYTVIYLYSSLYIIKPHSFAFVCQRLNPLESRCTSSALGVATSRAMTSYVHQFSSVCMCCQRTPHVLNAWHSPVWNPYIVQVQHPATRPDMGFGYACFRGHTMCELSSS